MPLVGSLRRSHLATLTSPHAVLTSCDADTLQMVLRRSHLLMLTPWDPLVALMPGGAHALTPCSLSCGSMFTQMLQGCQTSRFFSIRCHGVSHLAALTWWLPEAASPASLHVALPDVQCDLPSTSRHPSFSTRMWNFYYKTVSVHTCIRVIPGSHP